MSAEKVMVFDTTLRDGEQAAGSRLGVREKLEVARQLARLGVDILEAGFPISSPKDFEAVELIAKEIEGPIICGLSRAVMADIDACGKALAKAKRSRIHTGLGVSDIHIAGKFADDKYGKTLGEKKAKAIEMTDCLDVGAARDDQSIPSAETRLKVRAHRRDDNPQIRSGHATVYPDVHLADPPHSARRSGAR